MNEVSVTKIGLLTTNLRLSRVFSELLPFLHMKNSFLQGTCAPHYAMALSTYISLIAWHTLRDTCTVTTSGIRGDCGTKQDVQNKEEK